MSTKRQILARWKKLAGDDSPEPWTDEDEVFGLFENFRPRGKGVEAVFEDVEGGDEILPRLLDVYKATAKSGEDAPYFIATPAKEPSEATIKRLVRRHLDDLRDMAKAVKAKKVLAQLEQEHEIEITKGEPSYDSSEFEDQLRDVVIDFKASLKPIRSQALLLEEGLYSMAMTYAIPDYVLWPLYQGKSKLKEPFEAAYQLWKNGVTVSLPEPGRVVATIEVPEADG